MQGGKQNCFALLKGVTENLSISHLKDGWQNFGSAEGRCPSVPCGLEGSSDAEGGRCSGAVSLGRH